MGELKKFTPKPPRGGLKNDIYMIDYELNEIIITIEIIIQERI